MTEIKSLREDPGELERQIQTLLQETLSEIIQDELVQLPSEPLSTLLQDSIPQGCDEASLQHTFQRQIQDRLPSLRQNLFRSARQKLFKDLDKLRNEDRLQNLLQDHLHNRLHNRLQELHLGQLKNVFCALRQRLLDKRVWLNFRLLDFPIWVRNLCKDRFQQLLQEDDSGCFSELFDDIPSEWRACGGLRYDLVVDLLLDTFSSFLELEEVLPKIDAPPEPRLAEDRLPELYETLYDTLRCDVIVGDKKGADREALLETLSNALEESLNSARPPSEPAPNQGAALAAG